VIFAEKHVLSRPFPTGSGRVPSYRPTARGYRPTAQGTPTQGNNLGLNRKLIIQQKLVTFIITEAQGEGDRRRALFSNDK